ncbi:MAG: ADP-L-glycero-D-manno-heptose 6-epimerase [bacterium]|jgi:ADP-L-glycero-D-manno-heptose 6-epimerase
MGNIVVTGAAGFIGSCLAHHLFRNVTKSLILVDDFNKNDKKKNVEGLETATHIARDTFIQQLPQLDIDFIFHLGARTDTTEFDVSIFDALNLNYSKSIWRHCAVNDIPLIYASSAATYGDGELGFDDDNSTMTNLKPLNPYGQSKLDFDIWASQQTQKSPFWIGLKFFNVFGPNEYHKTRMASVIFHAFNQIKATGKMKLFESHNPDYGNGGQTRDFIYVKDLISVMMFWYGHKTGSGVYNLGTGQPKTFNDLANATFKAMGLEPSIEYIPTPKDIRDKYQYYTKAEMARTLRQGYTIGFTSFDSAIEDYVINYLKQDAYF